jgi:hypothetical protein
LSMPEKAEIYFYSDPTYDGDLNAVLDILDRAGHRVVMGRDPDELRLLVQLERPTAIVFTFVSEGSALSSAFKIVSRTALNHNVPILVIGPGDPEDGVTMYYPDGSQFKRRAVPFDLFLTAVEQLKDKPLPKRVTETEISTEGIYDSPLDQDYEEPAAEPQIAAEAEGSMDVAGAETNGPIAMPIVDDSEVAVRRPDKKSRGLSGALLVLGAAICLVAALLLSAQPNGRVPSPVRLSSYKKPGGLTVASDNAGRFVTQLNLTKGDQPEALGEHDAGQGDREDGGPR